eukprot:gene413-1079_t
MFAKIFLLLSMAAAAASALRTDVDMGPLPPPVFTSIDFQPQPPVSMEEISDSKVAKSEQKESEGSKLVSQLLNNSPRGIDDVANVEQPPKKRQRIEQPKTGSTQKPLHFAENKHQKTRRKVAAKKSVAKRRLSKRNRKVKFSQLAKNSLREFDGFSEDSLAPIFEYDWIKIMDLPWEGKAGSCAKELFKEWSGDYNLENDRYNPSLEISETAVHPAILQFKVTPSRPADLAAEIKSKNGDVGTKKLEWKGGLPFDYWMTGGEVLHDFRGKIVASVNSKAVFNLKGLEKNWKDSGVNVVELRSQSKIRGEFGWARRRADQLPARTNMKTLRSILTEGTWIVQEATTLRWSEAVESDSSAAPSARFVDLASRPGNYRFVTFEVKAGSKIISISYESTASKATFSDFQSLPEDDSQEIQVTVRDPETWQSALAPPIEQELKPASEQEFVRVFQAKPFRPFTCACDNSDFDLSKAFDQSFHPFCPKCKRGTVSPYWKDVRSWDPAKDDILYSKIKHGDQYSRYHHIKPDLMPASIRWASPLSSYQNRCKGYFVLYFLADLMISKIPPPQYCGGKKTKDRQVNRLKQIYKNYRQFWERNEMQIVEMPQRDGSTKRVFDTKHPDVHAVFLGTQRHALFWSKVLFHERKLNQFSKDVGYNITEKMMVSAIAAGRNDWVLLFLQLGVVPRWIDANIQVRVNPDDGGEKISLLDWAVDNVRGPKYKHAEIVRSLLQYGARPSDDEKQEMVIEVCRKFFNLRYGNFFGEPREVPQAAASSTSQMELEEAEADGQKAENPNDPKEEGEVLERHAADVGGWSDNDVWEFLISNQHIEDVMERHQKDIQEEKELKAARAALSKQNKPANRAPEA